ncbi:MAG: CRTAC1 family protein [Gemmatimonadales bacterium]
MLNRLPRRKRLVVYTAGAGALFLALVLVVVWSATRQNEVYRPGESIEGLTSTLSRELPADYPRVTFVDVSAAAGIQFRHFGGRRSTQLPEDMGSGAAWRDYDRDGWLDLYVVNMVGPITLTEEEVRSSPAYSRLYRNNGDGTFTDVSFAAGVAHRGWGMGAVWGDYDNDGWPDLFVTAYGENVLYRNNGDGTFSDRTAATGLGGIEGFWAGASWADYDRDGFLDLYVTGYVRYEQLEAGAISSQYEVEQAASLNPSSFPPERNLLYHNNGDGTFTEVAERSGVLGDRGRSLEAAWTDLDNDGWPELYVANDVSDNVLFLNRRNGTFEDVSHAARVADYRGAMGIAVGDWDGDTDMDMFVTHWIAQENALYRSLFAEFSSRPAPPQNLMQFMDEADRYGLGQISLDYIGFGTTFFDYDNDGKLDLFVANGSTFQRSDQPELLVGMRDILFWNRGSQDGFYDVSDVSGEYFSRELVGRGAAAGDYDGDGDLDLFIVNHGGPGVLLRNEGGNRNNWLQVALQGNGGNRSAIGTKIRIVVGGSVQVRELGSQASYLSQNSAIEHFGLGAATAVDTLEIRWPSGLTETLTDVPANRVLNLVEGRSSIQ